VSRRELEIRLAEAIFSPREKGRLKRIRVALRDLQAYRPWWKRIFTFGGKRHGNQSG
jgi:hypothetical protein